MESLPKRGLSLIDKLSQLVGKRIRLVTTVSVAGAALTISNLEEVGLDYVVVTHGSTKILINLRHIVAAWSAEQE